MSLLTTLKERLSVLSERAKNSKVFKAIASLTLASAMAVTPLAIASCNTKPSTPDSDIVNPNPPTPGDDITKYSPILQTVLTSDYYNNLIDNSMKNNAAIFFSDPNFAPIPYNFLQQNGHNIEDIKNNTLSCETSMYYKENDTSNLYMSVHVENNNSSITDYVLKYNLTNKEYADMKMLFEKDYIQAPLFVQELSKQKSASVESKVTLTANAYDLIDKYFNGKFFTNLFNSSNIEFNITHLSAERNEFKANVRSVTQTENSVKEIRQVNGTLIEDCTLTENNSVYNLDMVVFDTVNSDEFKKPGQTIYYFDLSSGYTTNDFNNIINID